MGLLYIREAVIACIDVDAAVDFHRRAFGFDVVDHSTTSTVLAAAGAPSGRLRLVPAEAASDDRPPRVYDLGTRLLGLYSHRLEETVDAIESAGGHAGPPVSYPYGTATLREMVGRGTDGVWWTIPEAVPGAHRPSDAYAAEPDRLHSELHSAVLVVDDHEGAVQFFKAAGLVTIFDEALVGESFERLVGLPSGASLRLAFMAGPDFEPARFEIMSFVGVDGEDRTADRCGIQRLVFACDDVATTTATLLAAGAEQLPDGALRGPAGVVIELTSVEAT